MGGITRDLGGIPLQIGGVEDHAHILVRLPPTIAIAIFMRDLKARSSGWSATLSTRSSPGRRGTRRSP
jgi:hypothetical protein